MGSLLLTARSRAVRSTGGAILLFTLARIACGCRKDEPCLEDVTAAAGFPEDPPPYPDGRYQLPEISAGGIGLLDFDGDGDLDILQIVHPPPDRPSDPAPDRLFRQEAGGAFVEVPGAAGLNDPGYGNGVALGD